MKKEVIDGNFHNSSLLHAFSTYIVTPSSPEVGCVGVGAGVGVGGGVVVVVAGAVEGGGHAEGGGGQHQPRASHRAAPAQGTPSLCVATSASHLRHY